jgi:transposase
MTFCCVFCTRTAYAARAAMRFPPSKRPTDGDDQSFPTTAVGSVARSLTCSVAQSGGRLAIVVPRSSKSCAASLKASRTSISPTNWPSIAPICSHDATKYRPLWPRIFPPTAPLDDPVTEADELYQNAGEKGRRHAAPTDPPRRRANQARGHGTWASDRPPIVGIVGRRSGQIRLRLCHHSDRATLQPLVTTHTRDDAIVNTDEWSAYRQLGATGRIHSTVCHTPGQREWARDDDGDGIREVHNNTMEGIWTGYRNLVRFFRGISKWFLAGYIAVFEASHNLKSVTPTLLSAMMTPSTTQPT